MFFTALGSFLFLLVLSVAIVAADTKHKGRVVMARDIMGGKEIRSHVEFTGDDHGQTQSLETKILTSGQTPAPTEVERTHETSALLFGKVPPVSRTDALLQLSPLNKRQNGKGKGVTLAAAAPPTNMAQTTLPPIASSISISLTNSASSALASVSSSFEGQLGALSAQSSADIAAASGSASSVVASLTASAASAIASISASASSAVASANAETSLLAASASSVASAASSSAAASAMSMIAAMQTSFVSEVSGSVPSATAEINNIVQPNSSGSSDNTGAFLVTPSQIAAIVIGTIVGTAILTLLVVYGIMICRQKRAKRYHGKLFHEDNDEDALNRNIYNNETGRAERQTSRDEKRTNFSMSSRLAMSAEPILSSKQMNIPSAPQKAQLTSQRSKPSLPSLPEESPRVSDQFDLDAPEEGNSSTFDFHALSYTPEQIVSGFPSEPEPVRLTLTKRQSRGGSRRLAVTRVDSVNQKGNGNSNNNKRISGLTNPYFSGPLLPGARPFQRPALVRTPSSDTLPHSNSGFPSPLGLNPPIGNPTTFQYPPSTWGTWRPESPRTAGGSNQYESLSTHVQPDYSFTSAIQNTEQRNLPGHGQNHISFLLQRDANPPKSSPRVQAPLIHIKTYGLNGTNTSINNDDSVGVTRAERPATTARHLLSSPQPIRPVNHASISPISPYSSTFENPLASPTYISPLSPPPKSPLRAMVRLSKSEYSLRDRNVSPLSSTESGKATPPLPLRRLSRSSGELGSARLSQATAGLHLNIGPVVTRLGPSTLPQTIENSVVSRTSSVRSQDANMSPNGRSRFTFLVSNGNTPESNGSTTPTNPWGPLPALTKRRSSSLGRIEIPPEHLTAGGIYVGAPGPKFTLFPRTDGGSGGSIPALAPVSPLGMPRLGHGKSRSTGNVYFGKEADESSRYE